MNKKIIDDLLGAILGVFGFGVMWTNLLWIDVALKITVSGASAFLAGMVGYLGKVLGHWIIMKIKSFNNKKKKNGRRKNRSQSDQQTSTPRI